MFAVEHTHHRVSKPRKLIKFKRVHSKTTLGFQGVNGNELFTVFTENTTEMQCKQELMHLEKLAAAHRVP